MKEVVMKKAILFVMMIILMLGSGCSGGTCPPCPPCPACDVVKPVDPKPQSNADLDIIDMNDRRDGIGNIIIVGLIKNNGPGIARQVEVTCSIFGSSGSLIDVHTTYPRQMTINSDQETAFECYLDEISPATKYECTVHWN
jgi:hypothetical protein